MIVDEWVRVDDLTWSITSGGESKRKKKVGDASMKKVRVLCQWYQRSEVLKLNVQPRKEDSESALLGLSEINTPSRVSNDEEFSLKGLGSSDLKPMEID